MNKQQELGMSARDRDRLKVLHEAEKGRLTQKQAGVQLKLSERWVRELVGRLRKEGDGGILHRLRGRASKRKLSAAVRAKVVRLVKGEYADFGPTLAAEYLGEKHGVVMSKESVRQILMEAGVWKRKRRRVEEIHVWRARRSCGGEMVQWDSSEHDWLEGRGPQLFLLAMIDDATSRALARFAEHDSTEENFLLLESYLKRWGRPGEFYTDKDSLFRVNRAVREADDEAWPEAWTQIGRALKELGVGWIAAHSPQAKGRIERFFGTAQDRLVKGLRQAGAHTLAEANAYLEQEYLPLWNRRFTVEAKNATDAHRPLRAEHNLAAILSHVEERVVANDYTIRYNTQKYQIARTDILPGLRGATVRVEERRDQTVWVRFRDRSLEVSRCEPMPERVKPSARSVATPRRGTPGSPWMKDFHLRQSPPLWKIIRQEQGMGKAGGSTP
jgi:DNA-binding Lrp family transcriptional regulator